MTMTTPNEADQQQPTLYETTDMRESKIWTELHYLWSFPRQFFRAGRTLGDASGTAGDLAP